MYKWVGDSGVGSNGDQGMRGGGWDGSCRVRGVGVVELGDRGEGAAGKWGDRVKGIRKVKGRGVGFGFVVEPDIVVELNVKAAERVGSGCAVLVQVAVIGSVDRVTG